MAVQCNYSLLKTPQTLAVDPYEPLKAVLLGKPASPETDLRDKMVLAMLFPTF